MYVVRFLYYASALLSLCVAGCCTTVRSEAELFLRRHPDLRARYIRLSPTDVASLKERADFRFATWRQAITVVHNSQPDQQLAKEIERRLKFATATHVEDIAVARELEQAVETTGGQVYFYEFREGTNSEVGHFVLHDGRIVAKAGVIHGKRYD